MEPIYLSIQPVETGKRIKQLLSEQNYTIREIQGAFGFENPQAIYKWIAGKSLPSLDNFIILSRLLHTSVAFRAKCKMFSRHLQKPILKTEKGRFKGL